MLHTGLPNVETGLPSQEQFDFVHVQTEKCLFPCGKSQLGSSKERGKKEIHETVPGGLLWTGKL